MGEHRELTAIKSAGISLLRIIRPIFVVVVLLAIGDFLFYNYIVPKANLKAYALLYDIRSKKLAFDIKPGTFYEGLPGYTLKVDDKLPDGKTLKGVIIYDHNEGVGNNQLILADSGQMYTIYNQRYLVLELFKGNSYSEVISQSSSSNKEFVKSGFNHNRIVFSLASFDFNRTDVGLFSSNRMMRNVNELYNDLDSMQKERNITLSNVGRNVESYYMYYGKSLMRNLNPKVMNKRVDSAMKAQRQFDSNRRKDIYALAASQARNIRGFLKGINDRLNYLRRDERTFSVEFMRKFTMSAACVVLFLIGAPIGAIIRKGGLGMPVIVSIIFFILFYIASFFGEKSVVSEVIGVYEGMWAANAVLFFVGLFFIRQAYYDANLFDFEFYTRLFSFNRKKSAQQ